MTTDRVSGAALIAFALYVLWESRVLPLGTLRSPGPAYMPVVLALLVALFGALTMVLGGRAPRLGTMTWAEGPHAVAILAVCAFAALALERLGYRVTIGVSLAVLIGLVERRSALATLVFAAATAAASYFVFDTLLRVPLPRGPFGL